MQFCRVLTWFSDVLPTMDNYKTLNVLLDALFDNNCLQNWSVFEEISGSTVVKLRFTKSINSKSEVSHHQSFRRKYDSQIQRDRNRAARHRAARGGRHLQVRELSSMNLLSNQGIQRHCTIVNQVRWKCLQCSWTQQLQCLTLRH